MGLLVAFSKADGLGGVFSGALAREVRTAEHHG